MTGVLVLAHGGTTGLVLEVSFFLVPIILFAVLAWWSGRRNRAQDAIEEAGSGPEEPGPDEEGLN